MTQFNYFCYQDVTTLGGSNFRGDCHQIQVRDVGEPPTYTWSGFPLTTMLIIYPF